MEEWRESIHINEEGRSGFVVASKKYFEPEAVLAVAGMFSAKFYVEVRPKGETDVILALHTKGESGVDECLLREVLNSLSDQQLRRELQKDFGGLRDSIVRYAFAPMDRHHV